MRAFAVTAVILYHASTWANGGYFGVDVFFVLSGYLITTLLLAEWRGTGGIGLRSFWARRARRLLPALFLMLAVVGAVAVALPQVLGSPGLLGDTIATVFYVSNWHLLASHTSYFDLVANQSPLLHTWSLAIEEQFYLVWPLVVLVLVGGLRHRGRTSPGPDDVRRRLILVAAVAAVGAVASAVLMAVITPVGTLSVNRSYYGSDTRAQSILVGAALAAVCLAWGPVRTAWGRRALWVAGLVGAVAVVVMWRTVQETSALTFHGGFFLVSVATAGVIACVTQTSGHPVARVLCFRPLPYIGRISYGMYLWYLPVLLVMTAGRTHLDGLALLAARVGVIVVIAAASFHFVETPIRRGALAGWRTWVAIPVAAATVSLLPVFVPTLGGLVPVADAAAVTQTGSSLPFTAPSAPASPQVRILLVGDSMAGSLGVGLSTVAVPLRGPGDQRRIPGLLPGRGDPGAGALVHRGPRSAVRQRSPTPAGRVPLGGADVRSRRGGVPGPERHLRHRSQRELAERGPVVVRPLGSLPLPAGHGGAGIRWRPRGPDDLALLRQR